jgi:hypothetical protein
MISDNVRGNSLQKNAWFTLHNFVVISFVLIYSNTFIFYVCYYLYVKTWFITLYHKLFAIAQNFLAVSDDLGWIIYKVKKALEAILSKKVWSCEVVLKEEFDDRDIFFQNYEHYYTIFGSFEWFKKSDLKHKFSCSDISWAWAHKFLSRREISKRTSFLRIFFP